MASLYWPKNNNAAGPFLTLDLGGTLFLEDRFPSPGSGDPLTDPARQRWAFDAAGGGLLRAVGNGSCVGAAPRDDKNVWGRRLVDGSWALALANFNRSAQMVTCDAACFAAAGFNATRVLRVRDLWARTDNGTVVAGAGLSVALPGGGASAFVRVFPTAAIGAAKA